jgi:type I restriction enzyme, S subunit
VSYAAYPETKPSGFDWQGNIPQYWQVKPLKYVVNLVNEKIDSTPDKTTYIGLENISSGTGQRVSSSEDPDKIVEAGTCNVYARNNVLFGKLRPYLAKVFHTENSGVCSSELLVLEAKFIQSKYLFYFLLSDGFIKIVDSSTYGAKMPRASWDFIGGLPILLPSDAEQQAIVAFLDRKTAEIDRLLRLKEQQIELLERKRQALISEAVTRGLDPTAPMQKTEIGWLGEIPAHWIVKRLKYLKKESFMYGANELALSDDTTQPRFIRITDLNDEGTLRQDTFCSLPEELAQPYLLKNDDFLFARSGATVGKAVVYSKTWGACCFAGYLIRLRPDKAIVVPAFLRYYTASSLYKNHINESTIQATIQNVSAEKYANFIVLTPPLAEQQAIVAFLDRKTAEIDTTVGIIKAQNEKLRQYRQALISEAVTGKIDVREKA